MILSKSDMKYKAVIIDNMSSIVNGVISAKKWTPEKVFDCHFYYKGARHFIVDVQFRTDVDAQIIADGKSVKESDLNSESRLVIYKKTESLTGTFNGSAAIGAASAAVIMTDSGSTKKGDIFYIGQDFYYVSATTKAGGQTTGLTFTPTLKTNVKDKYSFVIFLNVGLFLSIFCDDVMGMGEVCTIGLKKADL